MLSEIELQNKRRAKAVKRHEKRLRRWRRLAQSSGVAPYHPVKRLARALLPSGGFRKPDAPGVFSRIMNVASRFFKPRGR